MAWLNAVPVDDKGESQEPRIKTYEGKYPDPGNFNYLIEYLYEIGPYLQSGENISPVTWQEIKAWRDLNELELEAFELKFIRDLSKSYVNQYYDSININCLPPWREEIIIDYVSECERHKNFLDLLT